VKYSLPGQYEGPAVLLLPVDKGIVWIPTDQKARLAHPYHVVNGRFAPDQKALAGDTVIFYTPYSKQDTSLASGAVAIGRVPHAWTGDDGPVAASAWAGWLPEGAVTMPRWKDIAARQIRFTPDGEVESVTAYGGNLPEHPGLFDQRVKSVESSPYPLITSIQEIVRTHGGFVLVVGLVPAQGGENSGLSQTVYYWSEETRKWTPLTQLWCYQDLPGFVTAAGSGAVYWEQPLPAGDGKGNLLDVVQMYFDPASGTIRSVWLGDWFYKLDFADGRSWALENPGLSWDWTVYTPAGP